MHKVGKTIAGLLATALFISGCGTNKATSQPAGASQKQSAPAAAEDAHASPATSATGPVAARPSPAGERYREVYGDDEVVSVLDNGAVVIAKRIVGSPVLAVRGYVRTGGIYEGKWLGGGLSHLLEHLVAGGSNSRRTEAQSRELLQQIGNNSNAYTSEDHTAYFINTTPPNLEKAADLLTGWVLHALITPDEFRREYEVVQRELEMGKGEPGRQFYYMMSMNRYQVSPARVPVIGYQEVIQGLSRDDVYSYYLQAYQPNNMVFAVAGDLPPEQMLKAMRKYIDSPPGRVFDRTIPDEPAVLAPRTSVAAMPKIGDAKVAMAFPSVRLDHPDLYALDLLAAVLGQSEGSVLVREVRDKQLVSSISAYSGTPEYVDGSFVVNFQCKPEKIETAIEAVQLILDRAKREPLDAAAVKRAQTQMRVAHLRELQETANVAATMATDYMSTGDVHFSEKYLERIAAVTPADLQAVARKYIDTQKLIKTVMLPEEATQAKGLPAAEAIVRRTTTQATTAAATTQPSYEVQRSVLDNGTILLVRRVPTSPLIAVRMYALGGLTAEDETVNGVGNFAMRMLPRGTSFRSARQLAEELEAIGASIETSCGNNTWYWNASMLKDDFEKGMELYADVVNNPAFPDAEVESMRKRIMAALAAQDADWSAQAMRFFKKQYFPATSPYRLQTIGDAEVVGKLQSAQLKDWYQQKVLRARRVLAIYGDVDPGLARQVAGRLLGGGAKLPENPPQLGASPKIVAQDLRPQVNVARVEVQKTQQPLAGVVIGFNSGSLIGEKDTEKLDVADTVTSGWGYPTGYLHETLRGEGLVYVVAAQNWPGRNAEMPGTFLVYAGCEPSKVNRVVDEILLNIARLQGSAQDIQEQWFDRAMQLLITDDAMSNETVAEQATTEALDELWGLGYAYHRGFAARVGQVKLGDVQNIARARLRDVVVTISTPNPEIVKVPTGQRLYDKFPPVELTPRGVEHDMPVAGK